MRHVSEVLLAARFGRSVLAGAVLMAGSLAAAAPASDPSACDRPVYLTFDTGHMGVADLVAQVLQRHGVQATFFLAQERTQAGDGSLGEHWAGWWRERAREGHAFASHTWDHWVWQADRSAGSSGPTWRFKATQGPQSGQVFEADERQWCAQLREPARRWHAMTGLPMAAAFRAPAGRTSPALLAAAQRCGFEHVGWAAAGFLGDELPSDRYPNAELLRKALRDIRPGDVLVAHLGIWSRRDPWAPAVLEPLIEGLKARGLCFRTLRDHPQHGLAFRRAAPLEGPSAPALRPKSKSGEGALS